MRTRQQFAPLLLAVTLALGFGLLWSTAICWIAELVESDSEPGSGLIFRQDGTPLLRSTVTPTGTQRITDLHGAPVEIPEGELLLGQNILERDQSRGGHGFWSAERADWRQRIEGYSDLNKQATNWYFVSDGRWEGTAYLVGYDEASKRQIGFLGREGFRLSLPDSELFPFAGGRSSLRTDVISGQPWQGQQIPVSGAYGFTQTYTSSADASAPWKIYVRSRDHRLYQVDLRARSVRPVLEGETIVAAGVAVMRTPMAGAQIPPDSPRPDIDFIVRTDRDVILLDHELHIARRYALPRELLAKPIVWSEIAPGKAVGWWTEIVHDPSRRMTEHITWFDASGTVARHEDLSLPASSEPSNVLIALAAPCLAIDLAFVGWLYPMELQDENSSLTWPDALRIAGEGFWLTMVLTLAVSVLLAVCCYRRQARYAVGQGEQWAWTLFVFLGGLPGWIGYRYARRWPVLEICPHCGLTIPRDRCECAQCHGEMPRPIRLGTEVFA